jgi:hypothetical protein
LGGGLQFPSCGEQFEQGSGSVKKYLAASPRYYYEYTSDQEARPIILKPFNM